jgi:hypothetical protein
MKHAKAEIKYRNLAISGVISAIILICGLMWVKNLGLNRVLTQLIWPLTRLMFFITLGLVAGQIIEASNWMKSLAKLAAPLFRFACLGPRPSAAFTTAFFSGVSANAMLLEFYNQGKITKKQLFLSNFINQVPAFFLHLPTTFFIVIPLTKWAGVLYFLLTFLALVLRTAVFVLYGHFQKENHAHGNDWETDSLPENALRPGIGLWAVVRKKLPARVAGIAVYVLPIYIFVYVLNAMGLFETARRWLTAYVAGTFIPMESLSLVVLSFAAEFTSGFAAAGAMLEAGVLTVKQTVLALLIGNIVAFPVRALRHQLPRYMGIFSPKMGAQILGLGQGFRVLSLAIVGVVYYFWPSA